MLLIDKVKIVEKPLTLIQANQITDRDGKEELRHRLLLEKCLNGVHESISRGFAPFYDSFRKR